MWYLFFGEAHPLRQDDTEAVKKCDLIAVGLSDAPQADLAVCRAGQHNVVRVDACQFLENGARRVTETGALLPHLQALPQYEGEEADEDVGLNAIFALVPDRTQIQLILLDAEGDLGLRELDVRLPELLIAPIIDVRAQEIGTLREFGPVIE